MMEKETTVQTINSFVLRVLARVQDEEGQGLTEYGLILALVAIASVAALTGLGTKIGSTLSNVSGSLK
jgi:pilus assembly protein Flp/PilA